MEDYAVLTSVLRNVKTVRIRRPCAQGGDGVDQEC